MTELDLRDVALHPDFSFTLPPAMVRAIIIDALAEGIATSLLNARGDLRKADWIQWATVAADRLAAAGLIPYVREEDR